MLNLKREICRIFAFDKLLFQYFLHLAASFVQSDLKYICQRKVEQYITVGVVRMTIDVLSSL